MVNLLRHDPLFNERFERACMTHMRAVHRSNESEIRIDTEESDHVYVVNAYIPEVTKENITVLVGKREVAIRAIKDASAEADKATCTECSHAVLARTFCLAHEIDADRVEAHYENGVLRLVLPKMDDSGRSGYHLKHAS